MEGIITNVVGYSAAVVGTVLMLPQVVKSVKTKQVKNLSYLMVVLYFLNCLLWATYGILIWAIPIILCNFIALLISIFLLALKVRYSPKTAILEGSQ